MPDVYLRSIEPLIAVVLDRGAVATPGPLSLPSLGVSSLDWGRLWQRRRPFSFCIPPHRFPGPSGSVGNCRVRVTARQAVTLKTPSTCYRFFGSLLVYWRRGPVDQEIIQPSASLNLRPKPSGLLPTAGPNLRWVLRISILRRNGRAARPIKARYVVGPLKLT